MHDKNDRIETFQIVQIATFALRWMPNQL